MPKLNNAAEQPPSGAMMMERAREIADDLYEDCAVAMDIAAVIRKVDHAARKETEAQLAIIRALKGLDKAQVENVMSAVAHLVEADQRVPGVLLRFLRASEVLEVKP